ncbi:MAG: hypothetical protein M1827_004137 [Pycnora praestabilis]|nr:MAG: hypothetical protein M1827_004137 [Pycnora praestabilis]
MDEFTADAFVNRDDPLPVVNFPSNEDSPAVSDGDGHMGKRERIKKNLSATKLKEKLHDVGGRASEPKQTLQDRMFAKILQQIIPVEEMGDVVGGTDKQSSKYVTRPGFSLPLMTYNFRRFNSRIGVVFVFQNRLIRLFSWKVPTHTLSFLAVYTFVCLDPYILAVLPIAALLFFVMVPSFLVRHPPPPASLATDVYSIHGPPIAPPPNVKPVNELSKDFFRNMRDLQNSMDDFSNVHDQMVALIAPPTNFSNEPVSSAIFLLLFITGCSMFLASHILPWRAIFLCTGWAAICLGHPICQEAFLTTHNDHLRPRERQAQGWFHEWIDHDIVLDSAPETREVEIFELQRRSSNREWEGWIFSSSPFDPLSSSRISGDRPKGTPFFEDVQAPKGWEWSDKKWTLDLLSREWVEERMITGVEIETEGERWVFDIKYDDLEQIEVVESEPSKGKGIRKDWEESSGLGRKGQWRRRRWIRRVKRRLIGKQMERT